MKNKKNYIIGITFIWIGFVSAISFMEAWLKFQAPGITIKLGLGIGQLVFGALNTVEIIFASFLLIITVYSKEDRGRIIKSIFLIPVLILLIQSFWLLPELDHRAHLIIEGVVLPKSSMHFWFVVLEVMKVISLLVYGIQQLSIIESTKNG